jgi:hypothetical protein
MEYRIEDTDDVIDWISVFETLSTRHFDPFRERLGFPIPVSPELREIAKQFSLATFKYFNIHKVIEEPIEPLYTSSSDVSPYIQILNNTLARLEAAGYGEVVYQWGLSMFELKKLSHTRLSQDWGALIRKAIATPHDDIGLPPLSDDAFQRLQGVARQYAADYQALRDEDEAAKTVKFDSVWEQWAGRQPWMFLQVRAVQELSMWKTLFATLTLKELEILDQWGKTIFEKFQLYGYFSLVEFAREIV